MSYKYINIYGPTASGKTYLSYKIAEYLEGEIINFDSCQFNNYLHSITMCPIGNPYNIKEYLFNFLPPNGEFSVKNFIDEFEKIEKKNNNIKILVGGSGFYLYCLLKGLGEKPEISKETIETIEKNSKEENWESLIKLTPEIKNKLHVNDVYRVNNYLGFFLENNYSMDKVEYIPILPKEKTLNIFIHPPREDLLKNIEDRTNKYFNKMVEESIEFHKTHDFLEKSNIIGYKIIYDYINNKISKEEAINKINIATRQYAKTQVTFLKNKLKEDILIRNVYDFNLEDFSKKYFNK
jgi:tRNA dimethylallyltransferase